MANEQETRFNSMLYEEYNFKKETQKCFLIPKERYEQMIQVQEAKSVVQKKDALPIRFA